MDNSRDLDLLLKSNHPLLFVETKEESRAVGLLRDAANRLGLPLWRWSATTGLARDGSDAQYGTEPADGALDFILAAGIPGIFVLCDAAPALSNPVTLRRLREAVQAAPAGQSIVITGTDLSIPADLSDLAYKWHLRPPSRPELQQLVRRTLGDLTTRGFVVALNPDDFNQMVDDLAGLTVNEAERVIQRAAVADDRIDAADLRRIRQAKAEIVSQDGVLELIESPGIDLDAIGGLETLKRWLRLRGRVFLDPAWARQLDPPKGILMTGVPGCGKSLAAKAVAQAWELPLVLLDPGRLYSKYVGESEERLASTLHVVEALAPAVLWIDEIEKGFGVGGDSDGGVSRRVLGTFLRWLQERESRVFLVATSNDVRSLPPEFLRRGRFDEVFFVDLPDEAARRQIFEYHLGSRDQDPATFDLDQLVAATAGFSGAEIEAAVVGALYHAFAQARSLATAHILAEIRHTVPLSRARPEDVAAMRAWAEDRARAA